MSTESTMDAAGAASPKAARLRRMVLRDYRFVWRLLRRLGLDQDEASDAAQEAFAIAASRVSEIAEKSERAFLFGTALRLTSTLRRRKAREVSAMETAGSELVEPAVRQPSVEELLDQKRARMLLDEILEQLPEELRVVFVLYELETLAGREIAELLALPPGTVASRLRRARSQFRKHVKRYELAHAAKPRSGGA